ncbi:MAG TPA: formate dehydrogenase accessory protein FdhE [Gemmatimonadales bacterium]|jgi:FdhE protein
MQRTAPGLRTETAARLAELERQRPEWHTWISLLGVAERALNDEGWRTPLNEAELARRFSGSPEDAPLLNGRMLEVNTARIRRLVRCLASTASAGDVEGGTSLLRYRPSAAEALGLISAAVRQDEDEIKELAAERGVDAGALASVAHLAAFPLLQSCGRLLGSRVPPYWHHGYCPVCAAWPILAERRGLDRSRRLRCGRCAAEWEVQWLYCIYCGEREHDRLGSLEPDDRGEMLKVETCATCRGYLKSIASLQGFPAFELLLQDLETVEFDLVALDRGYRRPLESGFALDMQIVDHASRRDL